MSTHKHVKSYFCYISYSLEKGAEGLRIHKHVQSELDDCSILLLFHEFVKFKEMIDWVLTNITSLFFFMSSCFENWTRGLSTHTNAQSSFCFTSSYSLRNWRFVYYKHVQSELIVLLFHLSLFIKWSEYSRTCLILICFNGSLSLKSWRVQYSQTCLILFLLHCRSLNIAAEGLCTHKHVQSYFCYTSPLEEELKDCVLTNM